MAVIYYIGLFVCAGVTTFAQQKYGRSLGSRSDIYVYALVTGVISMLFFYLSSGFSIVLNLKTLFYSLIFAGAGIAAYFVQLLVYRYMGVAEVGVITTCGKLLITSALGILLFSETVTPVSLLRIGLMTLAVLLLFMRKRKRGGDHTRQTLSLIGLLLCAFTVCIGVINTVVMKYVAIDPAVVSRDSLFFLTNAFIPAFSAAGDGRTWTTSPARASISGTARSLTTGSATLWRCAGTVLPFI